MEQLNNDGAVSAGVPRRTVVKGAAWSLPVIAATIAAPMAAASGVVISGTTPVASAVCSPAGDFSVTVTNNGAPVVGAPVTVTLPAGFSWPGGASNPQVFMTDGTGTVNITGVTGPSKPGTYSVTASVTTGGATTSTTVPIMVQGTWLTKGSGFDGTSVRNVYTNPTDVNNLGSTSCVAYCIEHNVTAPNGKVGYVGDVNTFVGVNNFSTGATITNYQTSGSPSAPLTGAQIQAKVEWILMHSYPKVSLSDLAAAAGLTGSLANISVNTAIEAAQNVIWDYTDRGALDGNWPFGDGVPGSTTYEQGKAIYTYLANGSWNDTATAPSSCVKVISSANADCATPTTANHLQSVIMVCDCA